MNGQEGPKIPKEKPALHASFLTAYPMEQNLLQTLLQVLFNHDEIFRPTLIELGRADSHEVVRFKQDDAEKLSQRWDEISPPEVWHLVRRQPAGFSLTLMKDSLDFVPFLMQADEEYIHSNRKAEELLNLVKQLYGLLHPAHGEISTQEMISRYDSPFGGAKLHLSVNLRRALPNLYWANFLGPEYVRMFGPERVLTTPCYLNEKLSDGGVLLVLTESPFDYEESPANFDQLRQRAKEHLGIQAFDTGDPNYKGKIPTFRFISEKRGSIPPTRSLPDPDEFFRLPSQEWTQWIDRNRGLATAFMLDMKNRGVGLDLSPSSFRVLDEYIRKLKALDAKPSVDFLKKMVAYVSQLVIQETGAKWSFKESDKIPSLVLGGIHFSPIARAEKALVEGETFEHWFRFLTEELIPKTK